MLLRRLGARRGDRDLREDFGMEVGEAEDSEGDDSREKEALVER